MVYNIYNIHNIQLLSGKLTAHFFGSNVIFKCPLVADFFRPLCEITIVFQLLTFNFLNTINLTDR